MKNIYLNSESIHDVFNYIKTSYQGVLNVSDNEFNLALNSKFFRGNINLITFGSSITSIQVHMTFLDDITVSLEACNKSSIVFAYCNGDDFKHSFGISGEQSILRNKHSAILNSNKSVNTILHFKKNSTVQFTIIKTEISALKQSANDSFLLDLKNTFLDRQPNFIYHDRQCAKIEEMIYQFKNNTDKGTARHAIKREIIESLLLLEIEKNISPILKMTQGAKNSVLIQIKQSKKVFRIINNYAVNLLFLKTFTSKNISIK